MNARIVSLILAAALSLVAAYYSIQRGDLSSAIVHADRAADHVEQAAATDTDPEAAP